MRLKIDLVTSLNKIIGDFGSEAAGLKKGSVGLVTRQIDIDLLHSDLAKFLGNNIRSTAPDSPASRLVLLHTDTHGEQLADLLLANPLGQCHPDLRAAARGGAENLADALTQLSERVRRGEFHPDGRGNSLTDPCALVLNEGAMKQWSELRTSHYRWPVFGSPSVKATNAEAYIEACAAFIRVSGLIPISAGESRVRPSRKTLASMGKKVLGLVDRFDREEATRNNRRTPLGRKHLRLIQVASNDR